MKYAEAERLDILEKGKRKQFGRQLMKAADQLHLHYFHLAVRKAHAIRHVACFSPWILQIVFCRRRW